MITGRFDNSGRALVCVAVYLHRLNLAGAIDMQVDTGANITCLHSQLTRRKSKTLQ